MPRSLAPPEDPARGFRPRVSAAGLLGCALLAAACAATPEPAGPDAPAERPRAVAAADRPSAPAAAPPPPAARCPPPPTPDPGLAPWDLEHVIPARGSLCVEAEDGVIAQTAPTELTRRDASGKERFRVTLPEEPAFIGLGRGGDLFALTYKSLLRFSPAGAPVFRIAYQEGHSCGAPSGFALGYDDAATISCGYSLMRFDAGGVFQWQVWPLGDHHTSAPLVDSDGLVYLSGDGQVAAVDAAGKTRWTFSTGANRYVHRMALTPAGDFVFETGMAKRHSSDLSRGGREVRRYYPYEPPELLVLGRGGALIRRGPIPGQDGGPAGWPEVLALPRDGSGRIPALP